MDLTSSTSSAGEQTPTRVYPEKTRRFEGPAYRLPCPRAGLFQCTMTDLRFQMKGEGEVLYHTVQWDEGLLYNTGQQAAGPLWKIDCPQDAVCQLHLPHCDIPTGGGRGSLSVTGCCVSGGGRGSLSVAHVSGGSVELVPPLRVTDSHVVVDITGPSEWGLVRSSTPFLTIEAQVLLWIYHAGPTYIMFNVVIVPRNVPLSEASQMHEECTYLGVNPNCKLTMDKIYSFTVDLKDTVDLKGDCKTQPKRVEMWSNYGPNYHPIFQVFLPPDADMVEFSLMEGGLEGRSVWKRIIYPMTRPLAEARAPMTGPVGEQLQTALPEFMKRVSSPVLACLVTHLRRSGVVGPEEAETIDAVEGRPETARFVLEAMVKKGAEAATAVRDFLWGNDPYLCEQLGLSPPDPPEENL